MMERPDVGRSEGVSSIWLWMAGLLPLLMVFAVVALGGWTWGFMDDLMLRAQSGSVPEKFSSLFTGLWTTGRLLPTWAMHSALFYTLFRESAFLFYFFRFFEISIMLGVWAWCAFLLTGRRMIAIPFFLAVALSFFKIYDAFFYLSLSEPLGLLFSGVAVLIILFAVRPALSGHGRVKVWLSLLGTGFVLLATGCKETFVVLPAAIGMALCGTSFLLKKEKKGVLFYGISFLVLAFAYILLVKGFLMRGYSASYDISWSTVTVNALLWMKKDFWNHAPWLVVLVCSLFFKKPGTFDATKLFGVLLSAILYVSYCLGLLPWSTWGHYVIPLGVFFALFIVILCVEFIEDLKGPFLGLLLAGAIGFNAVLSTAAVRAHYDYQRDSQALVAWIAQNALFLHEVASGKKVRCNAYEPASAIPTMANLLYGTKYKGFMVTSSVREIMQDPDTKYYVWGPFWGDQDLRRLGDRWTPMFYSGHWVVFRRMY